MMALDIEQRRAATRLQRQARTLREIAATIGASRADVALWLYGRVADWTPPRKNGAPAQEVQVQPAPQLRPAAASAQVAHGRRVWTPEQDAKLRELAGTMGVAGIAAAIGNGISLKAVRRRAGVLGLALTVAKRAVPQRTGAKARNGNTVWTPERIELARRRGAEGATALDLAAEWAVPLQSIRQGAAHHGIVLADPGAKAEKTSATRAATAAEVAGLASRMKREAAGRLAALGHNAPLSPVGTALAPSRFQANPIRSPGQGTPKGQWLRLRHPDGRWLSSDGLVLGVAYEHAYRCQPHQLAAARRRFPLAAECEAIVDPDWRPRDLDHARALGGGF